MFGTELHLLTFILIVLETIFYFQQFSLWLIRRNDKSRRRFLTLISMFIQYNLCSGLFPDPEIPINLLIQNILAYGSGILLATYYFYYLVKELKIKERKIFNAKILIISLSSTFIFGFILTYLITGDFKFSKKMFIAFPVIIAVYFCIQTVFFIRQNLIKEKKEKSPFSAMIYSGYLGIIFMASMPIVVFFGDFQTLNNGLVNISFLLATYGYYKHQFYLNQIENKLLEKVGYFQPCDISQNKLSVNEILLTQLQTNNLETAMQVAGITLSPKGEVPVKCPLTEIGLSAKELEVAFLILKNYKYKEIGEKLYITTNTVTKHASNIFKKANCKDKKEFSILFGGLSKDLQETEISNAVVD